MMWVWPLSSRMGVVFMSLVFAPFDRCGVIVFFFSSWGDEGKLSSGHLTTNLELVRTRRIRLFN